jgi:dTDP-4-dehydrorhamnose reductase
VLDLIKRGALAAPDCPPILHVSCDEPVSRVEFATRVAAMLGADAGLIRGKATSELGQAAPRPLRGGLRNTMLKRLLGVAQLPLDDALSDCLPRMRTLYAGQP